VDMQDSSLVSLQLPQDPRPRRGLPQSSPLHCLFLRLPASFLAVLLSSSPGNVSCPRTLVAAMPFAAILGAGPLGGTLTHTLSSRALFDEVRLVDPAGDVAAGKALDIRQAGPPAGARPPWTGHPQHTHGP